MCCLMRSAAGGSWSAVARQRPSLRGGQGREEVTLEQIISACNIHRGRVIFKALADVRKCRCLLPFQMC